MLTLINNNAMVKFRWPCSLGNEYYIYTLVTILAEPAAFVREVFARERFLFSTWVVVHWESWRRTFCFSDQLIAKRSEVCADRWRWMRLHSERADFSETTGEAPSRKMAWEKHHSATHNVPKLKVFFFLNQNMSYCAVNCVTAIDVIIVEMRFENIPLSILHIPD